jgi:hypothetical protein
MTEADRFDRENRQTFLHMTQQASRLREKFFQALREQQMSTAAGLLRHREEWMEEVRSIGQRWRQELGREIENAKREALSAVSEMAVGRKLRAASLLQRARPEVLQARRVVHFVREQAAELGPSGVARLEGRECTICLDIFCERQSAVGLPCSHEFHIDCLTPWLLRNGISSACPTCKGPVISEASKRCLASSNYRAICDGSGNAMGRHMTEHEVESHRQQRSHPPAARPSSPLVRVGEAQDIDRHMSATTSGQIASGKPNRRVVAPFAREPAPLVTAAAHAQAPRSLLHVSSRHENRRAMSGDSSEFQQNVVHGTGLLGCDDGPLSFHRRWHNTDAHKDSPLDRKITSSRSVRPPLVLRRRMAREARNRVSHAPDTASDQAQLEPG